MSTFQWYPLFAWLFQISGHYILKNTAYFLLCFPAWMRSAMCCSLWPFVKAKKIEYFKNVNSCDWQLPVDVVLKFEAHWSNDGKDI